MGLAGFACGGKAEVAFKLPAGIGEGPAADAHEEVHAIAATPLGVFAAALVAEPGAIA